MTTEGQPASGDRFEALMRALDAYVWEMGPDLRFTYFSDRASEILPIEIRDIVGTSRTGQGQSEDPDGRWRQHHDDLAARRSFKGFVVRLNYPNNVTKHIKLNGEPRFAADGSFLGYIGTGQDVTQEVVSESKLKDAIEASSSAFVVFDSDDRLVMCNAKFRRFYSELTGVEPELGTTFQALCRRATDRLPMEPEERERWHAERLAHHRRTASSIEVRMPNDRWALIDDRRTADGGAMLLITDITELKAREAQLLGMRDAALRADHAKTRFLATMSHELRTPLNAILGFADVMRQEMFGQVGSPRYRQYLDDIHSAGKYLLGVISDVLDTARIQSGDMRLGDEPVEIGPVIRECLGMVADRARIGDVAVGAEYAADLPRFRADPVRLRQILTNLLTNAVKFTPPGGRVAVRADLDTEGRLAISVKDTGIGMSRDEIAVALTPFGQIANPMTRTHDGTGLGLPLAKTLAELHGGELDIASTPGAGTAVTVTLPARRRVTA
ncbi:MAG: PAS-domain containing protein [Rhodospirillaceae bacterium]|nr:PAS-domain containing protein [Rhodospirillaceae bacterium]